MGAIQGAINQVLGTAAAGVTLGKHITAQQTANALQKADVLEKQANAESDLADIKSKAKILKKEKSLLKKGLIPEEGSEGTMYTANIFNQDLAPDIEKRKLALNVLNKKRKARQMQLDEYKKILGGKQ